MENGQYTNAAVIQDYDAVKPIDQTDQYKNDGDILARRLRNRERQRRYRARKRIEADRQRASAAYIAAEPSVDVETEVIHDTFVNRILCKRDWKKDARKVNTQQSDSSTVVLYSIQEPMAKPPSEREMPKEIEMPKSKAGGRNWKAEARSKLT